MRGSIIAFLIILAIVGCFRLLYLFDHQTEEKMFGTVEEVRVLSTTRVMRTDKTGEIVASGVLGFVVAGPLGAAVGAGIGASGETDESSGRRIEGVRMVVRVNDVRVVFSLLEYNDAILCALMREGDAIPLIRWEKKRFHTTISVIYRWQPDDNQWHWHGGLTLPVDSK